ncbi:MAG TPA: bifunctional DNA-formamidopyrimidine glycosylase/DNA-(apurinic or apyrimidinic site) lyase [Candidatus Binatia bacterium]|jgi:formamidopyrimidine-DNA glycosylase
MPELPEVETLRRGLAAALEGRTVSGVRVYERRLRRPLARSFARALAGRRIVTVGRRAKYLVVGLDDDTVWLVHFGMTGTLVVLPGAVPRRKHTHVVLTLDDGRTVHFNDPRRFGLMRAGDPATFAELSGLGVEPLDAAFSADMLHAAARNSRRAVKSLLMDQRVVVGIGNIYANEILFTAGVRPGRKTSRLSREAAARVVAATGEILAEALAARGSSISDYRDERGEPGAFQDRFRVYERDGAPCVRCATPIRRQVIIGRSSFYCPRCQT